MTIFQATAKGANAPGIDTDAIRHGYLDDKIYSYHHKWE